MRFEIGIISAVAAFAIACRAPASGPSAAAVPASSAIAPAGPSAVDRIKADAKKLEPTVTSPFAKRFLEAAAFLPHIVPRTLHHDEAKTHFFTDAELAALPPDQRSRMKTLVAGEELYYNTKYGSPLSYSRVLDVLAKYEIDIGPKWRVLDFGYGYVGHLRLLASLGVDANGVDVDPMLRALYSAPGDQGEIAGQGGVKGSVHLFDGAFPKDPHVAAAIGRDYDLVMSKNVLKKGYIHPDRPTDKKLLIELGVSDEVFLTSIDSALKPGGHFLIYNISPALTPIDKPFLPWSDGRSPFSKAQLEAAGFKVLAFDADDIAAVNKMAHLLGWGDDPDDKWDIDHDLSVLFTLVEKPL